MHNDSQQSRLACTVIADESCLFAVFYMETGILENDFFAKGFTDILDMIKS